jgi:hypothetical protein
MSTRIPPSLKWLIDKRARIDAEIRKTKKAIAVAKGFIDELSKLEETLAALDTTFGLHEIQIDVSSIAPIRSQYVRIKLPHGELTRSVLLCLRLRKDENRPVGLFEIIAFIEARHADLTAEKDSRASLSLSTSKCLDRLYRRGQVIRHHDPNSNRAGQWSIKDL